MKKINKMIFRADSPTKGRVLLYRIRSLKKLDNVRQRMDEDTVYRLHVEYNEKGIDGENLDNTIVTKNFGDIRWAYKTFYLEYR